MYRVCLEHVVYSRQRRRGVWRFWQGMATIMPWFQGGKNKMYLIYSKYLNVPMTSCVDYSVIIITYARNEDSSESSHVTIP